MANTETSPRVLIRESEILEFFKKGRKTRNEIVGALVGIENNNDYLILYVYKYNAKSTAVHVSYRQLENSFLPAGLENYGTIHTHPGFGVSPSQTDLANLRGLKTNRVALIINPENFELKAYDKNGREIEIIILEDQALFSEVKIWTFHQYDIPFRVYTTHTIEIEEKCRLNKHLNRYSLTSLFGPDDLRFEEGKCYFKKPKVVAVKYRTKAPLYFFVKREETYRNFLERISNWILDFEHEIAFLFRDDEVSSLKNSADEVIEDGYSEIKLY